MDFCCCLWIGPIGISIYTKQIYFLFIDGFLQHYQLPKVQNMTKNLAPHMLLEGAGYSLLLYFKSGSIQLLYVRVHGDERKH